MVSPILIRKLPAQREHTSRGLYRRICLLADLIADAFTCISRIIVWVIRRQAVDLFCVIHSFDRDRLDRYLC